MTSSIFENTKNVLFYSDACFGLNKNSYVAAMFLLCVQELKNIECIDYKFLLPGHTHMACDIDHAIIGKQKKKKLQRIFAILAIGRILFACLGRSKLFKVE